MHTAATILAVGVVVLLVTALSERFGLPAPLALVVIGAIASYVPGVPQIMLPPELVLVGFLPPLLYSSAIRSSVIDFRTDFKPIALLAVVLVVVTAFAVGGAVYAFSPVSFAAALALGAVVAPPDAVAATSIARRIGLPRRAVTMLEGESLLNDATALVLLSTAVLALTQRVGPFEVAGRFALSVVGGVAIGLLVAEVVGRVRRVLSSSMLDVAAGFLAPLLAYLPAEAIGASGVLAVVVAGLLLGFKAPLNQTASSRVVERTNWRTISFVLENTVFLLLGLQLHRIVSEVLGSRLGLGRSLLVCGISLTVVIVVRLVYVLGGARWLLGKKDPRTRLKGSLLIGWAGMRGVVTVAAALTLPERTPYREVLVAAAMTVTLGTLLINGLSLGWLTRRLHVLGPDPREDALQLATLLSTVTRAGMSRLDDVAEGEDPDAVADVRDRANGRVNIAWERLSATRADAAETPAEMHRRLRLDMIDAERDELLAIRRRGEADHDVLKVVGGMLDMEEIGLSAMQTQDERLIEDAEQRKLTVPGRIASGCEHLDAAPHDREATGPRTECEDCIREGTRWVHLRMCLDCGQVSCCDSSPAKHAARHYADTGHPVMRSIEPGEKWRWCYIDEVVG